MPSRPPGEGADVVVHLAGVLFAPRPEQFLPITKVQGFSNLLDAALAAGIERSRSCHFPRSKRTRLELLPELFYPDFASGRSIL